MNWHIYNELVEMGLREKYEKFGVYSISIDDILVYVGKSENMLVRIATHIDEIEKNAPRCNKYKVLKEAKQKGHKINFDVLYTGYDIGAQEGKWIRELRPPLNYQIPKEENYRSYTRNERAQTITLDEILKGGNENVGD